MPINVRVERVGMWRLHQKRAKSRTPEQKLLKKPHALGANVETRAGHVAAASKKGKKPHAGAKTAPKATCPGCRGLTPRPLFFSTGDSGRGAVQALT